MGDPKQVNINNKGVAQNTYDAIVVGTGISGGWAAKELCQKGLKTLVLERGRMVEHVKDYTTANMSPWDFPHHGQNPLKELAANPISTIFHDEGAKPFVTSDEEYPYLQDKPGSFAWARGFQVGGRSLIWGRQVYRFSDLDFEANAKDGYGVDWPIRYKEIEPWYSYVENFIGVSGQAEGLPQLPDGNFLPAFEMNCMEKKLKNAVKTNYNDRVVTMGRVTNITRGWDGRGPCQARNLCSRGCPFGGYFSSNASTLPAAAATGNMTLLPNSIVYEVMYDEALQKATGVKVMNAVTKEVTQYFAKIIFLNASSLATAGILLRSTSRRFPNGLGNDSGQVGHNIMDHFLMSGARCETDEFSDQYYSGRRPAGIYIPRFRNLDSKTARKDYVRGWGYQGAAERMHWEDRWKTIDGFGADFKKQLTQPGMWTMWLGGWGETLPYFDNQVSLDKEQKDKWGLPLLRINFSHRQNEDIMRKDIEASAAEMMEKAGFKNVQTFDYRLPGGHGHEMGTARMGHDAKTSVVNKYNQMHQVKNVFITDGSFMTSAGTANPSLTYMAFTARACDFAVTALKKGNL